MTHLGERITDFVFGELTTVEMDDARRHIASCAECRTQVQQFERTQAMLKMSPDVEPPRRIVFEVEKRRRDFWRWLSPVAAAAGIVVAFWMGQHSVPSAPAPTPTPIAAVTPAPAPPQPIDYDRIVKEVRESNQAWLVNEMKGRDAAQVREITRIRGEMTYLDSVQRSMQRDTILNSASIQKLAQNQGSDSQD